MGFGHPIAHSGSGIFGTKGFLGTFLGEPGSVLSHTGEEGQAEIPSITTGPPFHFPESSLVYFQFVFAAITPILALGSVLGRVNFKAWIPYVRALDHVRVHGQRVPAVGRRLLRGARRAGLLRWLRDPPVRRCLRVRVRGGDRSAIAARSRDRRAEQPADGGVSGRVCCGSAGTGSTAGTPTTPAPTPRRRCSTPTCAPRWR